MHHLVFFILTLVWGGSFILMKKAALLFGPAGIAAGRVVGGGLALWLLWYGVAVMRRQPGVGWGDVGRFALICLCGQITPFLVQAYLIGTYGESGFFGLMVSFVPLTTMVVSVPLLGIRPTVRQVVGVIGGLGAMAALMTEGLDRAVPLAGVLLVLTVPVGYAVGNTLIKRWFTGRAPVAVSAGIMTVASAVLLPVAIVELFIPVFGRGGGGPVQQAATAGGLTMGQVALALGSLFVLGTIGTGLAVGAFTWLVQRQGPLYAGMVTYVVPFGAVLWGAVDGEPVTPRQVLALFGVLAMVALVQSSGPPPLAPAADEPVGDPGHEPPPSPGVTTDAPPADDATDSTPSRW
jgi:drug/metabolite transporter (DMT)-like permease